MATTSDLAVVSVYFNPCGYRSTVTNFLQFYEAIRRQTASFFAIELAFGDNPFYLPELERVSRVRTQDVLWQKDRLLNHLISQLPTTYSKVAWVDADVLFENDQWYEQTSNILEQYSVIQPYANAIWSTEDGRAGRSLPGIAAAARQGQARLAQPTTYHPGFAWAARRELLAKHGLFDACVVGGNDRVFAHALYGIVWLQVMQGYPLALQDVIHSWTERMFADIQGKVGFIEGAVRHLWHGHMLYRQYLTRDRILFEGDFDPRVDVRIGEDGAWHWASQKPQMHHAVRGFFWNRREDGESILA